MLKRLTAILALCAMPGLATTLSLFPYEGGSVDIPGFSIAVPSGDAGTTVTLLGSGIDVVIGQDEWNMTYTSGPLAAPGGSEITVTGSFSPDGANWSSFEGMMLEVTYTPEPGPLAMVGIGLAFIFGGLSRRFGKARR